MRAAASQTKEAFARRRRPQSGKPPRQGQSGTQMQRHYIHFTKATARSPATCTLPNATKLFGPMLVRGHRSRRMTRVFHRRPRQVVGVGMNTSASAKALSRPIYSASTVMLNPKSGPYPHRPGFKRAGPENSCNSIAVYAEQNATTY